MANYLNSTIFDRNAQQVMRLCRRLSTSKTPSRRLGKAALPVIEAFYTERVNIPVVGYTSDIFTERSLLWDWTSIMATIKDQRSPNLEDALLRWSRNRSMYSLAIWYATSRNMRWRELEELLKKANPIPQSHINDYIRWFRITPEDLGKVD